MFAKRIYSLQKKLYKSFALFSKSKDAFEFFFLLKMLRYDMNKVQVLRIRCVTGNHTECSLYLISISVCCSSTLCAATIGAVTLG